MADNDILQGFQLGFQSSLQRQRMKSEAALQRLQEQQIAQAMALKMQENALQNQFRAEMATAAQAMQDATSEEFMVPMPGAEVGTSVQGSDMAPPLMPVKNPSPMRRIDAFTQFMLPVISKFAPDKAGPIYNDVISNEVRMQQDQPFNPEIRQIPRPGGGTAEVLTTSPRSAQLMTPGPEIVEKDGQQFYQSGPNTFTRIPESASERQKAAFDRKQHADKLNFIREHSAKTYADLIANAPINQETGLPEIPPEAVATAAKAAGFQGSTLGQMEQQNISAENLVQVGKELFPLLTKENVGVRGFARRWGARLGLEDMPGFKGASDAEQAATLGRVFVASIFRTLRSDSNINEREVRALEAAAPDPAKIITQPEVLKAQMSALLRNAAEKSRSNAVRMGRDISPFFLTREEIIARGQAGQLTLEEAAQLQNNSAWKLIEALEVK